MEQLILGSLEEIFKDAEIAARSNEAVMILGETGVGKEVLARFIHERSKRRDKPFVPVNCAAIPPSLFESELFGYQKGAFTGAVKDKRGLLEEGDGGTIFLDEIGDLPSDTQAKLLRVIETREILPIGGTRYHPIDVRFITATNTDLKLKLERGEFRRDLYYRLSIFLYNIPPLRHRPSDIPPLVEGFIAQAGRQVKPSPAFMELFHCYPWPGNVRELRSAILYALAKCNGPVLEVDHLPPNITAACRQPEVLKVQELKAKVECFEARLLEEAIRLYPDPKELARQLGLELRTLYRKLKKYGIPTRGKPKT